MFHLSLGNNASPTLLDSLSKFGRHQIWLQMFELRCFPCFANWNCQQMINVVRRKPLGFARFAIFCYRPERCHPLSSVPIDMNSDMRWTSFILFSIFSLVILISCNMKKHEKMTTPLAYSHSVALEILDPPGQNRLPCSG